MDVLYALLAPDQHRHLRVRSAECRPDEKDGGDAKKWCIQAETSQMYEKTWDMIEFKFIQSSEWSAKLGTFDAVRSRGWHLLRHSTPTHTALAAIALKERRLHGWIKL